MEIKLIGFLKEHDDTEDSCGIKNALIEGTDNRDIVDKVIKYLKNGQVFFGWMGVFQDIYTNEYINVSEYYTDGIWAWPAYFPYYIKKYPEYKIDNNFLEYLKQKDFKPSRKLSGEDLWKLENLLMKKFSGWNHSESSAYIPPPSRLTKIIKWLKHILKGD